MLLWLKMRHIFIREGTVKADLRWGQVVGWPGMEETVLPG